MMQPGPPPDPGTEKRILLAFVLTFVVIALMQPLISRYAKPQPASRQQTEPASQVPPQTPAAATAAPPSQTSSKTPAVVSAKAAAKAAKDVAPVAVKQADSESQLVIENDLYRITFTNRGAQVKSWVLKKYDDDKGKPLELVHAAAQQHGEPLSLWTWDATLRDKLNSALYVTDSQGSRSAPAAVTFEFSDGVTTVRKTFSFDHTYVVRVEASVTQNGVPVAALVAWPAGFGDQTALPSYAASTAIWRYQDHVERLPAKKINGEDTLRGPFDWAGVSDQYFAAVFLPDDPASAAMVTLRHALKLPKDPDKPDPNQTVDVYALGAAVGSLSGATSGRMFVGPKSVDVLGKVHAMNGSDIEALVDFGTYFGWLARPLFMWLKWTHEHWVANWGWDILILTFIITLAVTPLRITSMKSALKMQKAQPEMKAIQDRYKLKMRGMKMGDPKRQEMMQQQNQEIGALMKREGANPVGGCLPLLLQFPFLVAFYSMLGVAIELRHANWLWIKDLSSPDPWHLLPIIFVASMMAAQRMTPQPGVDPVQQKMMMFMMPLMLGFMCWNLASGLAVYWAAANLLGIAQQVGMNNTEFGREVRATMEKRAAKKKR